MADLDFLPFPIAAPRRNAILFRARQAPRKLVFSPEQIIELIHQFPLDRRNSPRVPMLDKFVDALSLIKMATDLSFPISRSPESTAIYSWAAMRWATPCTAITCSRASSAAIDVAARKAAL